MSSGLSRQGSGPSTPQSPVEPAPIPESFDIQVTPENAQEVVEETTRSFRTGLEEVMIQPIEADAAAAAVKQELEIYLTGDFNRFLETAQSRGANMLALRASDDEEAIQKYRSLWESTASTIAFRPVSLGEVRVRPRYINGEPVPQPDLGREEITTAPTRYGLPEDPVISSMTIIEFVVPIMHIWEGEETPMWWGVWLAKHPESGDWLPWRFSLYDPTREGTLIGPVF